MTRVKICGIRSAAMAEQACAAGADALGMVFHAASPRAVDAQQAAQVVAATAPLVTTVGLFVDPEADFVREVLSHCMLDCLQFHGQESAAFCEQFERPYIRVVSMRPDVDIAAAVTDHPRARALLFDAWRADAVGGTGETFAWERLPEIQRPWILAGGLNAENVGRAVSQLAPAAVDVSGGVERSRGEKDPVRIRQFIAAVREADERKAEKAEKAKEVIA